MRDRVGLVAAIVAAVFVLPALAAPALAGDELIGDGHLARIRLGWDGFLPRDSVAPVTLLLTNPDPREHVLRVVVSPEDAERAEVTVTLPPGARKRITLALRATKELSVSLSEDGRLVAVSHHMVAALPPNAVLVVDGDPDNPVVRDLATGPIAFVIRPEDFPGEVACLAPFRGVILRMLDPLELQPEARAGLDDFVRAGGTVVVMGTADRSATRAYYDEVPGSAESVRSFPRKHRGLGQVILEPTDLGGLPDATTGGGPARRAALGQLLLATPRVAFPSLFVGEHPREARTTAGYVFAAFLATYLLLAGPVFMVAFRRARPSRVIVATVFLLLALGAIGVLTGLSLLRGTATVKVFTLAVITGRGEPTVVGEVLLESGGGRSHDIAIEGEDVSATWFGRLGRRVLRERQRWGPHIVGIDAATTRRGVGKHSVRFADQPTPVFGETSLTVLASGKGARPIVARVEPGPGGARSVVIENDCGHALGRTLVFERFARGGIRGIARFAHVSPGATLTAPLVEKSFLDGAAIGIPRRLELAGWTEAPTVGRDGRPSRFLLVAEDDPPIVVHVPRAEIEYHCWRVQDVAAAPVTTAGYLGITVIETPDGAQITAVESGSPADAAGWYLSVGRVLTSVAGMGVRSDEDLANVLGWAGPGATVTVVGVDGYSSEVQLADPPGTPTVADPAAIPKGG